MKKLLKRIEDWINSPAEDCEPRVCNSTSKYVVLDSSAQIIDFICIGPRPERSFKVI